MKIKVLQHHIDEGLQGEAMLCPIALAVKEQVPNVIEVIIGSLWVTIDGRSYRLNYAAQQFVREFDKGNRVEPFEAELIR